VIVLLAAALQFTLSLAICLAARPLGVFLGVMDRPDNARKLHRGAIPLIGGLAVLGPSALASGLLSWDAGVWGHWVILPVTAALFIMGMLDDRAHMRPALRLGFSTALFSLALIVAPHLAIASLDFGAGVVFPLNPMAGAVLTIISLVGFQYAFNMSDGANGIASGAALIWCLFMAASGAGVFSLIAGMIALGVAVFLCFNMRGRIFLGDSGAYGLSSALALLGLAIVSHAGGPTNGGTEGIGGMTNMQLVSLFCLPTLDCLRLILVRLRAGRAPFSPDREHLHHYLLRWTPSPAMAAMAYWAMAGVPCLIGWLCGGPLGVSISLVLTIALYAAAAVRMAYDRSATLLRAAQGVVGGDGR
jgi:UDP-GlcNAc:undecaprenyl-phosphate/decaprenyl-phosphate GlcNAc-1-phosphate transferase